MSRKKGSPLKRKLNMLMLVCLVPLTVMIIYMLTLLDRFSERYDTIVENITMANTYNIAFKEDMDYLMYIIAVNSGRAEELVDTEQPHIMIDEARGVFANLHRLADSDYGKNQLKGILKSLNTLENCVEEIEADALVSGSYDKNMERLDLNIRVLTDLIQEQIQQYIYYETTNLEVLREGIRSDVDNAIRMGICGFVAILTGALLVSRKIVSGITHPISRLCEVTRLAGSGDFAVRAQEGGDDELAVLNASFNQMVEHLGNLVEDIRVEQLNVLINNAGLIVVACGVTCVMLTGGIDISVGSVVAMDCMFLAVGMEHWGMSSPVLIVLVLLIGIVFGSAQGYCIAYLGIQPFIVTMAGLFFARGMTSVICTEQVSIVSDRIFVALANLKCQIPFGIGAYENKKGILQIPYVRITVIIALIVVVLVFLMLRYTKFGRSLYAVGGNQTSAALMGLNVKKTRMLAHVLCSFLASIGGICYCLNTMCGTATQATGMEMDAISSAVIGGTLLTGGVGNVIGTFFGVLINGTISTLVKSHGKLISSWANIITAILLCFFILLQAVFAKLKDSKK